MASISKKLLYPLLGTGLKRARWRHMGKMLKRWRIVFRDSLSSVTTDCRPCIKIPAMALT